LLIGLIKLDEALQLVLTVCIAAESAQDLAPVAQWMWTANERKQQDTSGGSQEEIKEVLQE
jgi:hypothetical protein